MPTNVQDLPPKDEVNVLNKHTGFPEPLSPDRNTTLPHPDADTSPNAAIEAPDVDLTHTHSRRSFLHSRHHSKHSFGKAADLKESGLCDNIQYANGSREDMRSKTISRTASQNEKPADPPSPDSGELSGIIENRDEQGYTDGERKKGVLRKLHLHKV